MNVYVNEWGNVSRKLQLRPRVRLSWSSKSLWVTWSLISSDAIHNLKILHNIIKFPSPNINKLPEPRPKCEQQGVHVVALPCFYVLKKGHFLAELVLLFFFFLSLCVFRSSHPDIFYGTYPCAKSTKYFGYEYFLLPSILDLKTVVITKL